MTKKRPPVPRRAGSSDAAPGHEPSGGQDATRGHTGGGANGRIDTCLNTSRNTWVPLRIPV